MVMQRRRKGTLIYVTVDEENEERYVAFLHTIEDVPPGKSGYGESDMEPVKGRSREEAVRNLLEHAVKDDIL